MMETLAVIVFCAGIFTFLYVSVLPLIGTYNDLIVRESDIDIVYKLYNIRLAIQKDNKLKNDLSSDNFTQISCSGEENDNIKKFKDENYCNNLMTQMELTNYDLFYTDSIKNNIESFSSYTEVYKYLEKHKEEDNPTLILIDNDKHTIAHLDYYEINPSVSMGDLILKKVPKTGTCSNIIYEEDGIKYFSGTNDCVNFNYVWYSGKLWRITAIYPDGAMKLITENTITSIAFNESGNTSFEGSYVYNWLNEDFYPTLYNANEIIDNTKKWNATKPSNTTISTKPGNTNLVTANVGLLNSYEYYNSYRCIESTTCAGSTYGTGYLNIKYQWWLLNPYGASVVQAVYNSGGGYYDSPTNADGGRPSIVIKSGLEFTGSGTKDNPYKIVGDKDAGGVNDYVNTRLSGEYVKLKNGSNEQLFRIIDVEDNKTKIIAMDYADNKANRQFATSTGSDNTLWGSGTTTDTDTWYDYLNNTYLPNLKTTYNELFDSGTYYLGTSGNNYKLSVCANTTSGNTKVCVKTTQSGTFNIGLPRYGEMFATQQSGGESNSISMWLINRYNTLYVWYVNYPSNTGNHIPTNADGARPTLHLKSTVKIKSGSGTQNDPYVVGL